MMVRSVCCMCFFFKQKTAYEMRISDWSSDVCSSDLIGSASRKRMGEKQHRVDARHFGIDRDRLGALLRDLDQREPAVPRAGEAHRLDMRRSEERRVGTRVSVRVDLGGRRFI